MPLTAETCAQSTTIHWHGLRVPADMDGTEAVQPPVEPGGTFEYRFVVPDAGTFWYHSHVNETEQLERGLYGALIVRGPDEPHSTPSECSTSTISTLAPMASGSVRRRARAARRARRRRAARERPARARARDRRRAHRALADRQCRQYALRSPLIGAQPFSILGTDGGLLPSPLQTTEVLITPGERVDLAVGPFAEGQVLEIALPYDRGKGERPSERFATVRVGAAVKDLIRRRSGAQSQRPTSSLCARRLS
jgi:FtsP/CotA-like multicopper oxidase with cupredoxin domain